MEKTITIGTRISQYTVEGVIYTAENHVTAVYKVYHAIMGLRAIKMIIDESSLQIDRIEKEAEILSQLKSPIIMKCLDYNVYDDRYPYIVMQYVNGWNLSQLIKQCNGLE